MGQQSCFHLVIQGNKDRARPFIKGLIVGSDKYGSIWFLDDLAVEIDSGVFAWFKELLVPEKDDFSLLVDEGLTEAIERGIKDHAQDLKLSVVAKKQVVSASFKFKFECFSVEHGEVIHKLLEEKLPEGVELSADSEFFIQQKPGAKGIELYTPVHDFIYKGHGTVLGAPRKVVEIFLNAQKEPLIFLENLQFEFE